MFIFVSLPRIGFLLSFFSVLSGFWRANSWRLTFYWRYAAKAKGKGEAELEVALGTGKSSCSNRQGESVLANRARARYKVWWWSSKGSRGRKERATHGITSHGSRAIECAV
uniref:Putative secreted protein n=1 Tax=Anopheles darlingi TaxID=43151 RepID=A0A2M4DK79_ANODA